MTIPAVGPLRAPRLPAIVEARLRNGLRVIVARRPAIPRFEMRLVIPAVRRGSAKDGARLRLLGDTLLSGTASRSSRAIAEELQAMGATLGTFVDADHLGFAGSALSSSRAGFLELLADVLTGAAFPSADVEVERERVVQDIAVARSQAGPIASEVLARRMYGTHPYGWGIPAPADVEAVTPAALRRIHRDRVVPSGSLLVLVGDLDPEATIADVKAHLGRWRSDAKAQGLTPPVMALPPAVGLVDRPDAVQTTIRMAGGAIGRDDPRYPSLAIAVAAFGGAFTSRLNDNIREQKGYTYGAWARVDQRRAGVQLTVGTDVGREVTAQALVEIRYELGRMCSEPITDAELVAARRYLQGSLAMGVQTQAGLAGYVAMLASRGLSVRYLADHPAALERVTVEEVHRIAMECLAPVGFTTVMVGDAAVIGPALAPLTAVEAEDA